MSSDEFTRHFAEMLGIDPSLLAPETELASLPEWDSVAYLSAMVLIDEELSLTVRPDVITSARTFSEILSALHTVLQD